MRLFRFQQLSFIFFLLFSSYSQATIISEKDYPFPIQDPLISTISAAANMAAAPYEILNLEVRKDRQNVPLLEDRSLVPLGLFEQKGKEAPLALVIAGTGGTALAGNALLLASQLYLKGFHAITLPDPISWHYVLGISESTLPGYPLRDAPEYYSFLKKVIDHLKVTRKLNFSNISLVGYSYGGLLSGYLAKQDSIEKAFNFQKVVIINPPLEVKAGMLILDQYYHEVVNIPVERRNFIIGELLSIASEMMESGFNLETIGRTIKKLQLTPAECRWLIGDSFRQNLGDVIYTSQQIKDLGILKSKATSFKKSERLKEAHSIGFREYFIRFMAPSFKANRAKPSREEMAALLDESSLYSIVPFLKEAKNVFLITNKDDFLVKDSDVELLEKNLQDRFILFPYGGHIGNLWFTVNRMTLEKIMTETR